MSQPAITILLGFPTTKSFRDLRFHLKALLSDSINLRKEIEELAGVNFSTPREFLHLRHEVGGISAGIEHVVSLHYAEMLMLMGQLFHEQAILEQGQQLSSLRMDWDVRASSEVGVNQHSYSELHSNLRRLISMLQSILEDFQQIAQYHENESKGVKQLEPVLVRLNDILMNQILSECHTLLKQVVELHREADPEAARQEDYWAIVDTPLREEHHPSALSLDSCPYCGAILTIDDRTFDGSYCENCRTNWIQQDCTLPNPQGSS